MTDEITIKVDLSGVPEIRSANARIEYAKNLPKINMLLGEIWHTNELLLLFADTGKGKSIFAVQIADALSKGAKVFSFLENENEAMKVLYYDFELSDKQFLKRYSEDHEFKNEYVWSENLFLDRIDFAALWKKNKDISLDELIFCKILDDINRINPKILIIDNITYLTLQAMDKSNVALELMRKLDDLKRSHDLSILVLAHTPKIAQRSPLTINDLSGSKHLSNFADSVCAIGESFKSSQMRYIKQIKPSRSAEMVYDSKNVICISIDKELKLNFLNFKFNEFESEFEHLNINESEESNSKKFEVIELHKEKLSGREIAKKLGISKTSAYNYIKEYVKTDPSDMPF